MWRFRVEEASGAVTRAAIKLRYGHLKDKQYQAALEFVSGKDVSVSLPTGSGKFLCYAVLPLFDITRKCTISPSLFIVVSPLIALMKDQVATLQAEKG